MQISLALDKVLSNVRIIKGSLGNRELNACKKRMMCAAGVLEKKKFERRES